MPRQGEYVCRCLGYTYARQVWRQARWARRKLRRTNISLEFLTGSSSMCHHSVRREMYDVSPNSLGWAKFHPDAHLLC